MDMVTCNSHAPKTLPLTQLIPTIPPPILCAVVCDVQLYVVKLHRKPLFPGIYTPVTITNNAGLIKEISDRKRAG